MGAFFQDVGSSCPQFLAGDLLGAQKLRKQGGMGSSRGWACCPEAEPLTVAETHRVSEVMSSCL